MVDSIPSRAEWKTKELWYKSDPEDKHTVCYRDPLQAITSLLGNPAYASDIVIAPARFSPTPLKVRGSITRCGQGIGGMLCR